MHACMYMFPVSRTQQVIDWKSLNQLINLFTDQNHAILKVMSEQDLEVRYNHRSMLLTRESRLCFVKPYAINHKVQLSSNHTINIHSV